MGPSRRLPAPKWTLLVSNSQVPSTPTFLLSPRFFSHPIFLQLQIKTELVKCALKNFTLRNPAPYASCALENLTLGNPAPSASCKRPQKPVDVEIFTLRNPAPAACYNRPQAPLEFCLPFPVRLCLRVRTVSKKDAKLSRATHRIVTTTEDNRCTTDSTRFSPLSSNPRKCNKTDRTQFSPLS